MLYNAFQSVRHPKVSLPVAASAPPFNTYFFEPIPLSKSISNCISIGSAVFAQLSALRPHTNTLRWAATPYPLKIAPSYEGTGPHIIHGSLGPRGPRESTLRKHHDQFSRFCIGPTVMTDRRTDRPRYSVRSNKPHLASAAMRPRKKNYKRNKLTYYGSGSSTSSSKTPQNLLHSIHPVRRLNQGALITTGKLYCDVTI